MKILHIFNELKFSGAEIMYADAGPFFGELGCELIAMSTAEIVGEYAEPLKSSGFDIFHYPIGASVSFTNRFKFFRFLTRFIKKQKIDFVHLHRSDLMWLGSLCAKVANVPSMYTFHNVFTCKRSTYPLHFLRRWSSRKLFGCFFQTISDSVFEHELAFYHNKTHKVYNWFSEKRFYPGSVSEREQAKRDIGIDADSFVIISIGGCSVIKRHTEVINALGELISKQKNVVYLHLGSGSCEKNEKELAMAKGIPSINILFCGNQKNVRKFLLASDVYVMTSAFEGISISTIEAMACGIPAVLYNVPGLRDFNKEYQTAIIIEESYQLLSQTIIRLTNDKKNIDKLIESALKLVNDKYSLRTNARKIFEVYTNGISLLKH